MAEPEPNCQGEHPDWSDLEALRTGEGSRLVLCHVASCPVCRALVHQLDGLPAAFRALPQPAPASLPAATDRAVLAYIARRLGEIRDRQQSRRWPWAVLPRPAWAWSAVAAAAMVLCIAGWWTWRGHPVATAYDVDRNGRIDILDAYSMARRLQSAEPPPAQWDFNGDGVIDDRDVAVVARRSVALKPEGV